MNSVDSRELMDLIEGAVDIFAGYHGYHWQCIWFSDDERRISFSTISRLNRVSCNRRLGKFRKLFKDRLPNDLVGCRAVPLWSLGMGKYFHPTLYKGCHYLSVMGLKLIHTNKRARDVISEWTIKCHGTKQYLGNVTCSATPSCSSLNYCDGLLMGGTIHCLHYMNMMNSFFFTLLCYGLFDSIVCD